MRAPRRHRPSQKRFFPRQRLRRWPCTKPCHPRTRGSRGQLRTGIKDGGRATCMHALTAGCWGLGRDRLPTLAHPRDVRRCSVQRLSQDQAACVSSHSGARAQASPLPPKTGATPPSEAASGLRGRRPAARLPPGARQTLRSAAERCGQTALEVPVTGPGSGPWDW